MNIECVGGDHDVVIVNPLGAALAHYAASLEKLLADCGAGVCTVAVTEPSSSGQRRERWVLDYLKLLGDLRLKANGTRAILVWPVLGYWDLVIAKLTLRHLAPQVVFHDPEPLNPAIGYGRLARGIGSVMSTKGPVIVHSLVAARVLAEQTSLTTTELPHPMFPPRSVGQGHESETIVRVLGQYKPDRDTHAMERLAIEGPANWRFEVVGRGWSQIPGWHVRDEFVAEDEFDALIRSSHAVLVPYRRFFQSGVALRCLELGTPVVGRTDSSLRSLIGADSAWLVNNDRWLPSTVAAVSASEEEVRCVASAAYDQARSRWAAWLAAGT